MRHISLCLALAPVVLAFSPTVVLARSPRLAPPNRQGFATSRLDTTRSKELEMRQQSFLEEAWAKYVLLRPGMSYDELRESTLNPETRTPGTVRTIFLTSFLCILVAIPYVLTNPAVFPRLIELAALDRIGLTPAEMLMETGRLW